MVIRLTVIEMYINVKSSYCTPENNVIYVIYTLILKSFTKSSHYLQDSLISTGYNENTSDIQHACINEILTLVFKVGHD